MQNVVQRYISGVPNRNASLDTMLYNLSHLAQKQLAEGVASCGQDAVIRFCKAIAAYFENQSKYDAANSILSKLNDPQHYTLVQQGEAAISALMQREPKMTLREFDKLFCSNDAN